MENSKRHVGRPKALPQTGPLVLSERRARAVIEIEIGAEAAEELAEYVRWVETSEGMSTADAQAATIEFALRNVFKRDRLWQQRRHGGKVVEAARHAVPPPDPPSSSSSSLPPSTPRTLPPPAGRGTPERPTGAGPEKSP